jgi:hypothetical protein
MRRLNFTLFVGLVILQSLLFPTVSGCQSSTAAAKDPPGNWLQEKPTGLYNVTTFSLNFFQGPVVTGMQTICGYKINPHLAVGGGVGLERFLSMPMYDDYHANLSLLPLFADLRYTVLNKRVSPVIAVNGGYKFMLNQFTTESLYTSKEYYPGYYWYDYLYDTFTTGGPFFSVEVGVKAGIFRRFGLYASLAYSLWSIRGEQHDWYYKNLPGVVTQKEIHNVENTLSYTHSFLIRIGFNF